MVCFRFPSSWAKTAFYFHFDKAKILYFFFRATIKCQTGERRETCKKIFSPIAQNVHNFSSCLSGRFSKFSVRKQLHGKYQLKPFTFIQLSFGVFGGIFNDFSMLMKWSGSSWKCEIENEIQNKQSNEAQLSMSQKTIFPLV